MSHSVRAATLDDLSFLADVVLLATRSHVAVGAWDLAVPSSEEERRTAIRASLSTDEPSWCHYANFLVAEVDGQPAAALSGYPAFAPDFLPMEQTFIRGMQALGFSHEQIGEGFQRMLVFASCHLPDAEGAWIVEFVACLSAYRRRGLIRELLAAALDEGRRRGHDSSQLTVLLGNDAAVRVYEGVGFETTAEKRDPGFEAVIGSPGLGRMQIGL